MKYTDREHRCTTCKYLLTGPPESGRCPECGADYGEGVLIIWGYHRLTRVPHTPSLRRLNRVLMVVMSLFMLIMAGFMFSITGNPITLVPLLWVALLHAWYRLFPRWHARITTQGCGMRVGPGKIKMQLWKGDEESDLLRQGRDWYHFTVRDGFSIPVQLQFPCSDSQAVDPTPRKARGTGAVGTITLRVRSALRLYLF